MAEARANARINQLSQKYNVDKLGEEARNAFLRLVQLTYRDIDALYLPPIDAARGLQRDIITLSHGLRQQSEHHNKFIDEYALVRSIIPADTWNELASQGYIFMKIKRDPCEYNSYLLAVCPNYNSGQYEFAVRITGTKETRIVAIPVVTVNDTP